MKKFYPAFISSPLNGTRFFKNSVSFLLMVFILSALQNTVSGQAYTITWQGLTGNTSAQNVPAGITVVTQYNGVTGTCVTTPSNGPTTSYSAVLRAAAGSNFTITSIGGTAYGSSAGSKDFTIQLTNGAIYTSATTRIGTSSSCAGNDVLSPLSVPAAGQTVTSGNQVTITILRAPGGASGGGYSYTKTLTVTGVVSPACTNGTINLTSGNSTQTVNQNSAISNIVYSIGGGASNASVSGLPAGVTGSYSGGSFTISGVPTATGTFSYTVTATGGCSNVTATGTITVNAAPTVSTTAASSVTSSGAVSGGNVTADGGSAVTARGVVYGTSANPTIAGTKTSNGSGTGSFTSTISGLQPNTQYFYRAYATNAVNTSYGSESSFNTLGAAPAAPILNGATVSSVNITVSANGNPSGTTYAIRETGSGNYVQSNGTLAAAAIWQTAAAWGTKTIPGLLASKPYSFEVKARNVNNVETAFGPTATKSTLANIPGAPIVNGATFSSLNVSIDQNNNSAFTEYVIYEATTGNFVQADGSLAGTPFWQIADLWGTKTVIDLASLTLYTFQVGARNPDLIESGFGTGSDGTTLDAAAPFLSATALSGFGDLCINTISNAAVFTLSGENLTTDDILFAAVNGYSYSTSLGGPYTTTLSISQPGGSFSQEIYVQFSPIAVQSYNGTMAISGSGADNLNINVAGNGINTVPAVVSTGVSGIGINAATVSANITLTGCSPVSSYGVEYSTVAAFANGTGTPVAGTNLALGNFSVSLNGLNTGLVYYYHAYTTNQGGTGYSSEGTFTTLTPSISVSSIDPFANTCINTTTGPNTFIITGTNLSTADVTVAALNGFSYSTDDNSYFPSLSISQPGGAFSQLIFVKFSPLAVQSYNGNVVTGGGGVTSVNRSVTGAGINTTASVTTGSSSAITQVGATVNGTINSIGCSAISVYGIEYSTTNGFANGSGIQVAGTNLAAGAYSVNLSGLNPAVTYYYKAYAVNGGGTVYGVQQSFVTLGLIAPLATAATSVLSNSFVANWNPVIGATSYRLDISPSSTFVDPNSAASAVLVAWTFETTPSGNPIADQASTTPNNTAKTLTCNAGSIGSVSGNPGLAATVANDWSNGANSKYWQISVDATGYYGLTISSQQQSSNTGPANFKLQYSLTGVNGTFIDIPGGNINVQNNFTSGVVSNLPLPAACYNQPVLFIRWIMSTNTSVNAGTVANGGTSRVDNIYVRGGNTPLFVTGYNNLTVNGTSQLVSGLSPNTTYYYRVRAFSTTSTSANSNTITVQTCPIITPTITGNSSLCQGSSIILTSSAASGYQWNLNGNPINGETNQTITITSGGNYTVTVTVAGGCTGTSAIKAIILNNTSPVPTINAGGPLNLCDGGSVLLTSSSATGNQWNLNGNPINGETNQTITATDAGDYSVTVTNASNCSSTSSFTTVTVNPAPVTPSISANGPVTFCESGSVVLTSSSATDNQWNIGGAPISGETAQTLTVSNSGDYTVTVTNGFGCSAVSAAVPITVNPLPLAPTTSVIQPTCAIGTGTINITAPLGAGLSYSISGPFGTFQPGTSFAGVAPGTYTVFVKNSADCIVPSALPVTVDAQPFTPTTPAITGTVNVCPFLGTGDQLTYTATATGNGELRYTWTLPPNVNLIAGGGSNTTNNFITVTFNIGLSNPAQANRQIRVTAKNDCGTSQIGVFYLLTQAPVTPNPITGPTNVCALIGTANTATYTINKVLAATGYSWSVPSNATVLHPHGAGVNDTTIIVSFPAGFAGGVLSVAATNGCGSNGLRALTINNAPPSIPGLISGPTNACSNIAPNGTAASYSVAPVTFATSYNWVVSPATAVVTPGAAGNTINVLWPAGFVSGTVTVTATNGCGTSAVRSLAVGKLNPATPGIPDVIQTHSCGEAGGRKYTYALATIPANANSVLWTVPAGASFVTLNPVSIEVSYPDGSVNGVVTVQAINNCGVSSVRSVTVKLPACPIPDFSGKTENDSKEYMKNKFTTTGSEELEIKIFPNPTITDTRLEVSTIQKEVINVRVLDMQGRLMKTLQVLPGQAINFGNDLKPGVYLVEVKQGTRVKTIKLIKF